MKFISTRGQSPAVSFGQRACPGARARWRPVHAGDLAGHSARGLRWRDHACRKSPRSCLRPFVEGDPIAAEIGDIVRDAFDFPAPLVPVADDGKLSVLELFHGPTAAFKDFGARFLAASLSRIRKDACRQAAQHPGGHLRRHRRRGGRGVSSAGPASSCPCCSPRAWCRPRRSASSPAGATTCSRTASTARSTTASGW